MDHRAPLKPPGIVSALFERRNDRLALTNIRRVYSSRAIISSPALRNLILAEFKLPLAVTKFAADYHYENVVASLLDENFDA
jgi:hypothetical protein